MARDIVQKIHDIAGLASEVPDGGGTAGKVFAYWQTGSREVVNQLLTTKPELLDGMYNQVAYAGSYALGLDETQTIRSVRRNDYPAEKIEFSEKNLYNNDTLGGIYTATQYYPVWYVDTTTTSAPKVNIIPPITGSEDPEIKIQIELINYTGIDAADIYSDERVDGIPLQVENYINMYVAIKLLESTMAEKALPDDIILPVMPETISFDSISESLPTSFIRPSGFVIPGSLIDKDVDFTDVPDFPNFALPISPFYGKSKVDFSETGPVFQVPVSNRTNLVPIPDLVITAVPPLFPTLVTNTVGSITSPPEYESPTKIVLDTLAITDPESVVWIFPSAPISPVLDFSGVDQVIDTITLPPDIVPPSLAITDPEDIVWTFPSQPVATPPEWSKLEETIDEEDPEMVNARIQSIQAKVQEYSQRVTAYGASVQAEVAENQGRIKVWGDEWSTKIQKFGTELGTLVQKYQGEAQGKVSIVQAQTAVLNAQLQEVIQKNRAEIDTFQAKTQAYTAEIGAIVEKNKAIIGVWGTEWQTRVQKFQSEGTTRTQLYGAEMQDALNQFNESNTLYQVKLQVALKDADLSSKDDEQKIKAFQADLQKYQLEVSSKVQEYQANVDKNTKVFTMENQVDLGRYQAEVQSALNKFQEETVVYQAKLQIALQDAQLSSKEERDELTKYQAEIQAEQNRVLNDAANFEKEVTKAIQKFQAETGYDLGKANVDVQNQMQRFTSELQNNTTTYQSDLSKFQADVANIAQNNQNKLAQHSADTQAYQIEATTLIQNFSTKLQKAVTDYQWMEGRYISLMNQYNLAVSGASPDAKQQQREVENGR